MDIFEAIHTRRSVRKYSPDPVSAEQIKTILSAAMVAPSADNEQCWRFVVVDDKELLEQIPKIQDHAQMVAQAPVTIVVCGDLKAQKYPETPYWIQDASAAMQNMLLAARGLGLGSCWCALHPHEEFEQAIQKLLNLPEHVRPLGLCVVGYALREPKHADRYDESKVHYNKWSA